MAITPANLDPNVQQLVYVKTNIAGFFFDAFLHIDYSRALTITEHPVETGANISDHSFINPVELTMQIGMTDTAKSVVPGQFEGNLWRGSRSLTAFQVLAQLQQQRIPLQVMTRLGGFNNMLIQSISIPDDYTTLYGLKATVVLKEIFVATVKTVKISARPQTTDGTNKGNIEPVQPNQSILSQWGDLIKGMLGGGT